MISETGFINMLPQNMGQLMPEGEQPPQIIEIAVHGDDAEGSTAERHTDNRSGKRRAKQNPAPVALNHSLRISRPVCFCNSSIGSRKDIFIIDLSGITTFGELKKALPSTGTCRVPGINQLRKKANEELEENVRKRHPDQSWLVYSMLGAVVNDRLYGRYKDIEPMIGRLMPRGYPVGSAAYLFTVRPELQELIYVVIRRVDDAKENYESLVYTFFLGVLTKGWGEGFGWSKLDNGNWAWESSGE